MTLKDVRLKEKKYHKKKRNTNRSNIIDYGAIIKIDVLFVVFNS